MNVLEQEFKIYTLNCPLTGAIRYIGYTYLPLEKRLRFHINSCVKRDAKTHRGNWFNQLRAKGLMPTINLLITCTKERVKALEVLYIAHYKQFCKLVNGTAGGDGMFRWVPTKEQRKKMSERNSIPKPERRKPVTLINIATDKKHYFNSVNDAAAFIKATKDAIRMVARGQRNSIFGFYCGYT